MLRNKSVQSVLKAYAGLLTQPFDQDLQSSVKSAGMSIVLSTILTGQEASLLMGGEVEPALEIGRFSMVLILVWMAISAIFRSGEERKLIIARNLSVVSFWIAVTLVVVLAVKFVFPEPFDLAIRLISSCAILLVLVPIHMFRNLRFRLALVMTSGLLISTWGLSYTIIY